MNNNNDDDNDNNNNKTSIITKFTTKYILYLNIFH